MKYVVKLPPRKIYIPDAQDIEQIQKLETDLTANIYLTREECEDYVIDRITGEMTYPVHSITINAAKWHLKPGNNAVPAYVYEFWQQNKDDKANAKRRSAAQGKKHSMGQLF